MNRAEHLAWAKQRALEYANQGQVTPAFESLISDLRKHPELANHMGIEVGWQLLQAGHLTTQAQIIKFIQDFS